MYGPDFPSTPDPNPNPSPEGAPPSPPAALLPPPSSSGIGSTKSRRLPPPCWSHEETIALIDAYGDKWRSLRRANLKADQWQEVADTVAVRCPGVTPQKTAVQCRHKMEKLRKLYRTEIQKARSMPVPRFVSSWVHYNRMEAIEKGPDTKAANEYDSIDDDNDAVQNNHRSRYPNSSNGGSGTKTTPGSFNRSEISGRSSSSIVNGGIRIQIPTAVSIAQTGPRLPGKIDQKYTTNLNHGGWTQGEATVAAKRQTRKRTRETTTERRDDTEGESMANVIKVLGETLMRTEQTKMEMKKEIEEMEMKRTEMILQSQQQMVEAFATALSSHNKKPRLSSHNT